jgi:hypothetical protein
MPRIFGVASLSLVLALLSACSSSKSAGTNSYDTSSADGFIAAYCDQLMPCCGGAGLTANGAVCRSFVNSFALAHSYNAAAGDSCLAEVRAASSSPTFCDTNALDAPSCGDVFASHGTSAPGTPCQKSEECASSTLGKVTCAGAYTKSGEIAKCQVQIPGKAGDGPCVGTVDGNTISSTTSSTQTVTDVSPTGYLCNMADGLACDFDTQKCAPLTAIGQNCTFSLSCVKSAYCDFSSPSSEVCVAKKSAGSACATNLDACDTGTYCDSTQQRCAPLSPDGGPCTSSEACSSQRCVNGTCAKDTVYLQLICGGA